MVAQTLHSVEWKDTDDREAVDRNRIGRLNSRLGSDVRESMHGQSLVCRGEPMAHKLPGGLSSLP